MKDKQTIISIILVVVAIAMLIAVVVACIQSYIYAFNNPELTRTELIIWGFESGNTIKALIEFAVGYISLRIARRFLKND